MSTTSVSLRQRLDELSSYDVALVSTGKLMRFKISYGPHHVWLQERSGSASIQLEVARTCRRTTGTRDWMSALEQAEKEIRDQITSFHETDRLESAFEISTGDPDLFVVTELYRRDRFRNDPNHRLSVSAAHKKRVERVWAIVNLKFGLRHSVSWYNEQFAERYLTLRTTASIEFPEIMGRRPCRPVELRTAINEMKDFYSVISYAVSARCVSRNPMEKHPWERNWLQGDQDAVEHMEEAHPRRHTTLMASPQHAPKLLPAINRISSCDNGARARAIQALLFHTGHRTISVTSLFCEDIGFTRSDIRRLLGSAKNHREWWADEWPYGAIFWRRSKADYVRVTPISEPLRRELDQWCGLHPNWKPGIPLFPQFENVQKAIGYTHIHRWMTKAVKIARQDLIDGGVPAPEVERWLGGDLLHGWRDHWATLMDTLGYGWKAASGGAEFKWDLHNHVAFMGDWTTSGGTQAEVYAKLNPGILQAVADFERAEDVVRRFSTTAKHDIDSVLGEIYGDTGVIPIHRVRR